MERKRYCAFCDNTGWRTPGLYRAFPCDQCATGRDYAERGVRYDDWYADYCARMRERNAAGRRDAERMHRLIAGVS